MLEMRRCRSEIGAPWRNGPVERAVGSSSLSIRNSWPDLLSTRSIGEGEQPKNEQRSRERSVSQSSLSHVNAWDWFPFVMAGWLSAGEAGFLVNQFFDNIAPWSPVVREAFWGSTYHSVLAKETFLSATLLTIASRFHALPGSSGRISL
ncbi:hypothetical protein BDV33DRAFT_184786, partial [Aspergillus novoparasiticus]